MQNYVYLYNENIILDKYPTPVNHVEVFAHKIDALKTYQQQKAKYEHKFPELEEVTQDASIPVTKEDEQTEDPLVINTGFSEVTPTNHKLRISIYVEKLPIQWKLGE